MENWLIDPFVYPTGLEEVASGIKFTASHNPLAMVSLVQQQQNFNGDRNDVVVTNSSSTSEIMMANLTPNFNGKVGNVKIFLVC